MEELWKEIPGYEGYYEVSTLGNIRSMDRIINCPWGKVYPAKGKPKKISKFKTGYLYVNLYKENKTHKELVHRLVAIAFIPNPQSKPCIDHIDGDRTNNNVTNLRWCSIKENNNNPITISRLKSIKFSKERNMIISQKLKGHPVSEETKKRISESQKLRFKRLKNKK